jgi:flagellin
MRINTNVNSLIARENNNNVNKTLSSSLEKLSSGLKINKAADDASGMSIADKLRTQASSIGQGISNANSANALIQIADKAMAEQSNILDIVKTKLIQASTSTTSDEGREAIRKDISKLLENLDNISGQTNYNGINLLQDKGTEFNFQIGEDSSYDVSMTTAYSVTTEGLGSSNESPVDADASLYYGTASGALGLVDNDATVTVQNKSTVAGADRAITINNALINSAGSAATDASFSISGTNIESISLKGDSASSVNILTSDADTISVLNALSSTNDALTRLSDGSYTFTTTTADTAKSTLDFNGKIDVSNLEFSGVNIGTAAADNEVLTFESDDEISITKLSGGEPLSIDSSTVDSAGAVTATATLYGPGSENPDALKLSTLASAALVLDSGTASMKVVQNDTDLTGAAIGINTGNYNTASKDGSFELNATEVEKLTLKMTAGTASVIMSTEDGATAARLSEIAQYDTNLTDLGNGSYQFSATAANADAVLDFGTDKVDITNLNFAGVQKGTDAGSTEAIYVQTDQAVTVTKNGVSSDQDISLQAFSGTNQSLAAAGQVVATDATSLSGSLAGLKDLKEGGLTAEVANDYMKSVDAALTQLNAVRSDFGSTQNQLDSMIRNMTTTQTNIKAAESVIRDVDYAAESANFNKQNIIAQAGTYAMSQANAVQQNVMRLLQ